VSLSSSTFQLVTGALEAWRITDARFDPTVLGALLEAGYDRTFDEVAAAAPVSDDQRRAAPAADVDDPRRPVPGPVGIELDPDTRRVTLPDGVLLDLGGIGKGRAADLVAARLRALGAPGVCVNLGGDVRVSGVSPHAGPWVVAVDDPLVPGRDLTGIALVEGAVATSSRTRRAWAGAGGPAHHLIDPATGRPAARGLAAVTVVARDAEWAEVLTKAAFVAGVDDGVELVADAGAQGLLVTDDGTVLRTPDFGQSEVELAADDGAGPAGP
jgi:thiamine biosynthesis lipoprotein